MIQRIDTGQAFNEGWAAFHRHLGQTILGWFLAMLIASAAGAVASIFAIFAAAPLQAGTCNLCLHTVRDDDPNVGHVFECFERYGPTLGVGVVKLLMSLVVILVMVVIAIIPIVVGTVNQDTSLLIFALATAAVVFVVLLIGVWILFTFATYAVGDMSFNRGVMESLTLSMEIGRRNVGPMLVFAIILTLLNLAGTLLCCVGLLYTMPLSMTVLAHAYDQAIDYTPGADDGSGVIQGLWPSSPRPPQ